MAKDSESTPVAKAPARFTAAEMRTAFMLGHAYGRAHTFNPQEMNAVKAAEEARFNWPD